MNPRTITFLSGLAALSGFAQGTFQNLDFESAVIVPITANTVQFAPAFPNWAGTLGSVSATQALHNVLSLNGISDFVLISTIPGSTAPPPLAGQFGIMLQSSTLGTGFDAILAQTALVPAEARSIRFLAASSRNTFFVSMGGQALPLFPIQTFGSAIEYGVDVSAFSGQTAELRFTQPSGPSSWGNVQLDNISFSSSPIPEPGTWALLGVGSALLWCAARRRRK